MNMTFGQREQIVKVVVLPLLTIFWSCTEPFQGTVDGFDDVLVVNSLITNESKNQEILLTRSYRFDEDGPLPEENAQVSVSTDEGDFFTFEEVSPGKYESSEPFAAQMERAYSLNILTQDGRLYGSSKMYLPTELTNIDNLYAERTTDDKGIEGMGIFVDSYDPLRESNYYRYDFIETYKIIAPLWSPEDVVFVIQESTGPIFDFILREREERICYGSQRAMTINVANTLNLSEDRLSRHRVRFIDSDNYILSHRYSILVKQYVQSSEAYTYYEALRGLTQSSTDIFSEDQPGFLAGNIISLDNSDENVSGFFEVAAIDEKRIFFNYEDFYPGEDLPPYFQECELSIQEGEDLKKAVLGETRVFYDINGGVRTASRPCGDCTVLGSNKVPDFWIE